MLNSFVVPQGSAAVNDIQNGRMIPRTLAEESYMMHLENMEETVQKSIVTYREYYDGDQDTRLTERLRRFLQLKTADEEFNLNICQIVVDAEAERLKVTGVKAGDTTQGELFWQWWDANRMDGKQGIIHTAALRDGDTYTLVEWDNEEAGPRFTHELTCAAGEGVKVHYSPERKDKIELASKRWKVGSMRRLNLYFADHIEKYVSTDSSYEGNWLPYLTGEEGEQEQSGVYGPCGWFAWIGKDGKPIGVPVVHFKNRDQGYTYGQSELKAVIPIQNALNKTFVDLLASADVDALGILVGLGDDWGSLSISPGTIVNSKKPPSEADLRRIPGESPEALMNLKNDFVNDAAKVTRTPVSYFQATGQRPAADTLQEEESGLVAKVEKCQTDFGNTYEDMFAIARKLYNTFGAGGLDEKQTIDVQWKDAKSRNEKELLETLVLKKQLGVSDEQIWREMGYNDEQIRGFIKAAVTKQALALRQMLSVPALPSGQPNNGMMAGNNPSPSMPQQEMVTNGRPNEQQQPAGAGQRPAAKAA